MPHDSKLYPPVIEGIIPAFYGNEIKVPFFMNKSVSLNRVGGFALKIKVVQSNYYIGDALIKEKETDKHTVTYEGGEYEIKNNSGYAIFNLSETIKKQLHIGQFYKIQLAYLDKNNNNQPGYYSTVGVVKYTAKPTVEILEMSDGTTFIGRYGQDAEKPDITEKVYSYRFDLRDNNNVLIETSGEMLHNSSFDTANYESIDTFTLTKTLEENKMYYLDYIVTTVNGMVEPKNRKPKRILKTESIDSNLKADIKISLNYEDGCVGIDLVGQKDKNGVEYPAVGSFVLLRSSDEDNYKTWNEVLKFALYGQQPSRHLWDDMTVAQGVNYKYAIQQFNSYQIRSNRIESDIVYVDFEHAYLYDGERQLKIKYNPKVSSFKNTLLENKVDTIGNKHPFIFRNGNVKYKEFPISGLISHLSDENNFFMFDPKDFTAEREMEFTKVEIELEEEEGVDIEWVQEHKNPLTASDLKKVKTTNLVSDNIHLERQFKLQVLEWLTNGQPKLFRSPGEGNYIVRLLNVSLSPTDSLGRMLHTFSSTAYEIADYNYKNLEKFNLITTEDPSTEQLRFETIELIKNGIADDDNILNYNAVSVRFEGMIPGDKIWIDDGIVRGPDPQVTGYNVVIGVTGSYVIDLENNVSISKISFQGSPDNVKDEDGTVRHQGTLTYGYYSKEFKDSFDSVNNIATSSIPCQQFIGEHNILSEIQNVRDKVQAINSLKVYLRDAEEVIYQCREYHEDGINWHYKFSTNINGTDSVNPSYTTSIYKLYHDIDMIGGENQNIVFRQEDEHHQVYYSYDENGRNKIELSPEGAYWIWDYTWYDAYNHKELGRNFNSYWTTVYFNGQPMDLIDTISYEVVAPKDITGLRIGPGVICELAYQKKVISYELEKEEPVKSAKDAYLSAYSELLTKRTTVGVSQETIKAYEKICNDYYNEYIIALNTAIKQSERG